MNLQSLVFAVGFTFVTSLALAGPNEVLNDLKAARTNLLADPAAPSFTSDYAWELAQTMTGKWVDTRRLGDGSNPGDLAKECDANFWRINASDPYSIKMTAQPDTPSEIVSTLVSVGGMNFVMETSAQAIELANHYDADKQEQHAYLVDELRRRNGPVVVFKTSPSVIILAPAYAPPLLLAKCGS